MAGEQEIITRFQADTKALDDAITREEQRLKKLEDEGVTVPVRADDKQFSSKLGSATEKLAALEVTAKKTGEAVKDTGEQMGRTGNIFTRALSTVTGAFKSAFRGVVEFGRGLRDGFRDGIRDAGGFRGILRQVGDNFRAFGTNIKNTFTNLFSGANKLRGPVEGIERGLGAANVQAGGLGRAFGLLASPIGIATAAVGGFFLNMTRLDSVQVTLDGIKRGFTGILDQLAAGKISVTGFFQAFEDGKKVAEGLDALNDRMQANKLLNAEDRKNIELLLIQSRDRTKTDEERIDILKRAQAITEQSAKREKDDLEENARLQLEILKQRIIGQNKLRKDDEERIKNLNTLTGAELENLRKIQAIDFFQTGFKPIEIDDDAAQAAVDAFTSVSDAASNSANIIERAQNRINLITDQGAEKSKKAAEDIIKANEKVSQLSDEARQIRLEVDNEALRSNLSETEQLLFDLDTQTDERIAKVQASIQELLKLAPDADKAKVEAALKEFNDAIAAIEANSAQQREIIKQRQAAAAQKEVIEANDRILAATLSATDKEIKAVNEKYDKLLADNRKFNSDANGLTEQGVKQEVELIRAKSEEITAIEKKANDERTKDLQKAIEERNKLILQAAQSLTEQVVSIVISGDQRRLEALKDQHDLEIDEIEARYDRELELNREANSNRGRLNRKGIEEQKALEAQRQADLLAAEKQYNERREKEEEEFRRRQRNAIIASLLDIVEAQVNAAIASASAQAIATPDSILTFGVSGIARAAILTAIIKGFFSALKASLTAAYEGEPRVGANGQRQTFPGERDAYMYRLHKDERVVRAKTNMKYFPILSAMENGGFERYIEANYVLPAVNAYLTSDNGQRMAQSVTFPYRFDRNIVSELRKGRETNERTLKAILGLNDRRSRLGPSKRYWA